MAQEYLLNTAPIPLNQIHFIPSELGPHKAAEIYEKTLSKVSQFDMVLLGMGEDGTYGQPVSTSYSS